MWLKLRNGQVINLSDIRSIYQDADKQFVLEWSYGDYILLSEKTYTDLVNLINPREVK